MQKTMLYNHTFQYVKQKKLVSNGGCNETHCPLSGLLLPKLLDYKNTEKVKNLKNKKQLKIGYQIKTREEGNNTQRSEEIKSTATITRSFKNITKFEILLQFTFTRSET